MSLGISGGDAVSVVVGLSEDENPGNWKCSATCCDAVSGVVGHNEDWNRGNCASSARWCDAVSGVALPIEDETPGNWACSATWCDAVSGAGLPFEDENFRIGRAVQCGVTRSFVRWDTVRTKILRIGRAAQDGVAPLCLRFRAPARTRPLLRQED